MIGLNALSAITGFASGMTYETTSSDLKNISSFICENNHAQNLENVDYIEDLYTLSGENRYVEVNLKNGYVIYDKKESKIEEYSFNGDSPYENYQNFLKVYSKENFGFKYVSYYDNTFIDCLNSNKIDFSAMLDCYSTLESKFGEYYRDIDIAEDAIVIDNAFYFQKLNNHHAWNHVGTCTIVSMEILLSYYDTFYNDLIIPENYDEISRQSTSDMMLITEFNQSPGVDNHTREKQAFHEYLCEIGKNEVGDDPKVDGMNTKNQIKLLQNYLSKQKIDYSLHTSEGNAGDIWTQRAVKIIKAGIQNNRPVISNGSKHSTVAFAYNDEYVWVHTGWGWVGATPWSTFESGLFENYSAGCIDISAIKGNHVHSDNYFSINKNTYICPCGIHHTSTLICPEDYGFEPQYFYDVRGKNVKVGNLDFYTLRKRTGFIENEYVNLSPYKQDAGTAFLELYFDCDIRKFEINLSYWQIKDKLSNLNSTAYLEVLKDGNWEHQTDLINEVTLSTDRTKQDTFSYSYIGEEIKGIRITMTSPATGTRNLGRISIGNIVLLHAV